MKIAIDAIIINEEERIRRDPTEALAFTDTVVRKTRYALKVVA